MIAVLSPAKTLDFDALLRDTPRHEPQFLSSAAELMVSLRKYDAMDLMQLMKISEQQAHVNVRRNSTWSTKSHHDTGIARQAILAFRGETYRNLDPDSCTDEDLLYGHDHVRILSGLYGLLRPLDMILPYRLEMRTSLPTNRGTTLYRYWGNMLRDALTQLCEPVINLASREYARAARFQDLQVPVITPIFRDRGKNGPRVVSVYAKRQRGRMARYIIQNRLTDPEFIKQYTHDGYTFDADRSSETEWVFAR